MIFAACKAETDAFADSARIECAKLFKYTEKQTKQQ